MIKFVKQCILPHLLNIVKNSSIFFKYPKNSTKYSTTLVTGETFTSNNNYFKFILKKKDIVSLKY